MAHPIKMVPAQPEAESPEVARYRLAALVESSEDAIISKTLEGIITSWNKGAERIFGYTAEEAIGRPISILIPRERFNEEPEILGKLRRGERIEHYETIRLRKDGRQIHISLSISPILDSERRIIGASKIARDITETKLAQARLLEDKKRIERINLELDSFVYIASHDLRSPLRAISSFVGMIKEECAATLNAQGRDYLNEIDQAAHRMGILIQDLLSLSRASRVESPYETVDVQELLQSVKDRLQHEIKSANAQIAITGPIASIYCDRIKISEVFVNLLSNAVKFSSKNPEGSKVVISSSESERETVFCIKDNGIGIDPSHHAEIFDMFKRLHRHDQYEGTGTGLYIVKRVVEDHGGRVWVTSEAEKGADFCFSIPKVQDSHAN